MQEMQAMAKVIQTFHDNIKCCIEYLCACCDQLWYRSSFRTCETNKYPKCFETLLEACITSTSNIDNTKWICSTCHSISEASKRHDNYTEQLVTDCNGDDGWRKTPSSYRVYNLMTLKPQKERQF